jgi:hypothetical protein
MPDGLVRPSRTLAPQSLGHGFGRPAPAARWPWPVAGAAIIGLSLLGWAVVIQGARMLLALAG